MALNPLLATGFIIYVSRVLFIIVSLSLVLIVLVQKGRGGGLGGVFGGGTAGGLLGSKTGDFLTWVTVALVGLFLVLAVVEAKFDKPGVGDFGEARDRKPPVRTEQQQPKERQPVGREPGRRGATELPFAADEVGTATSDVNESGGADSAGLR